MPQPSAAAQTSFRMPEIRRALPYAWHPDTRQIRKETARWADHYLADHGPREIQKIDANDASLWCCVTYSESSAERLLDLCKLNVALFMIDDIFYYDDAGDRTETIKEAMRILHGHRPGATTSPLLACLQDVWDSMAPKMTPRFRERFVTSIVKFAQGTAEEVEALQQGTYASISPDLEALLELRIRSMGTTVVEVLGEYGLNIDVTPELEQHTALSEDLRLLNAKHFLYTNDLFTYPKEHVAGDHENNLIHKFMLTGLTLQESVDKLAGWLEDLENEYTAYTDALLRSDLGSTGDVAAYIHMCKLAASGSLEYSYIAARYQGPSADLVDAGPGYAPRSRSWTVDLTNHPTYRPTREKSGSDIGGGMSSRTVVAASDGRSLPMGTGISVTVPAFYCPIPSANRPDAQAIEDRALRWITEMGAFADGRRLQALAAAQAGLVIPQAMPHALPDRIQIAADFMYWGFTFDDSHFEEGPLGDKPGEAIEFLGTMARIAEAPSSMLLKDNPWARALRDLRRRIDACATTEQSQRWVVGMQTLFSGLAWETRYRGREVCPDVDTYLMIRRGSIGMEPLTALNDLADGYVLPAEIYHAPVVRALAEMCWTLIICDNDLYSYNKEAAHHPNELNYLNCLAQQLGLPPQQALPQAVALRDSIMCRFLTLRTQVSRHASPELRRYLDSLGQWLRANLDWALSSHRYRPGQSAGAATYSDQPTATGDMPVPLASLNWWWDLDGVLTQPTPDDAA